MLIGNAMFQVFFSKPIEKRNRLKILSYHRYGRNGWNKSCAVARGGTCAFTLNIVSTLIENSSRDDRPSIST